jgi:anti-sigma regulatory factor (Ser/Thr protein kinase)
MASLTEVIAHVAAFCEQAHLQSSETLRVELVVEELFTNSVLHGYGRDSEQSVWLTADIGNGSLCITYQDAAPAYNPLNRTDGKIAPLIGGHGVNLVEKFALVRYLYDNGRNTLVLIFPKESA